MQFDFLILSIAPIPLKSDSIIEGAGIRAWNLADGLSQWNKKILILYYLVHQVHHTKPFYILHLFDNEQFKSHQNID
jgi:hypothetical protein